MALLDIVIIITPFIKDLTYTHNQTQLVHKRVKVESSFIYYIWRNTRQQIHTENKVCDYKCKNSLKTIKQIKDWEMILPLTNSLLTNNTLFSAVTLGYFGYFVCNTNCTNPTKRPIFFQS